MDPLKMIAQEICLNIYELFTFGNWWLDNSDFFDISKLTLENEGVTEGTKMVGVHDVVAKACIDFVFSTFWSLASAFVDWYLDVENTWLNIAKNTNMNIIMLMVVKLLILIDKTVTGICNLDELI